MVSSDLNAATTLMKSGRFGDALACLQKMVTSRFDRSYESYQVLLADALQLTGNNHEAEKLATELIGMRETTVLTLVKSHIVLGNAYRDRGEVSEAIVHFKKALTFAEKAGDREQACWASLRLMAAEDDRYGPEIAIGRLAEVRDRVIKLGDPVVLAALHLRVAEFESKRGLLDNARRHIQAGRTLLRTCNNVWLEGNAAIDDFCLSFLTADRDSALIQAAEALRFADVSGHTLTRMAACANLAHIHLALGHFEEAQHHFNEARSCCQPGATNDVAILDGLAQLALARGEFTRCENFLDEIHRIGQRWIHPGYYQSWSFRTKLQLLIRQRRLKDADEFSQQIGNGVDEFDRSLKLWLRTLRAELLVLLRQDAAAASLIKKTFLEYDGHSIEAFADLERVLGKALVQAGRPVIAGRHFERAVRIFEKVRNKIAITHLLADCGPEFGSNLLNGEGTRLGSRAAGEPCSGGSRALHCIYAMIQLAAYPELVAHETLDLLTELGSIQKLVLMTIGDRGVPDVIVWHGCELEEARRLACARDSHLWLSLGALNDRTLSLLIVPREELTAQIDCVAICRTVGAVLELQRLRREVKERAALWPVDELYLRADTIFAAAAMLEIFRTIKKLSSSNINVLITGETGTGKEVLARAIHGASPRALKVFLPFNCAAIPRELVESQLFGYRRGAFSGAHDHFAGVIRTANGGTLFLDEIGEIGLDVQPKLLRFLESGEIHPLGESQPTKVDVRVVAASNADLDQLVAQGRFREDLFYRLNVIRFRVPPLRERREEIPLLVQHFLKRYAAENQKGNIRMAEETMEYLILYEWPGNVRQLANETRRLVALAEPDGVLMPEHLTPEIAASRRTVPASERPPAPTEVVVRMDQPLVAAVQHVERSMLRHALKASGGRVEAAAKALGLSRKGLYLKRQRLGIEA